MYVTCTSDFPLDCPDSQAIHTTPPTRSLDDRSSTALVFGSVELKASISNEITLPVPQFTSQPIVLKGQNAISGL